MRLGERVTLMTHAELVVDSSVTQSVTQVDHPTLALSGLMSEPLDPLEPLSDLSKLTWVEGARPFEPAELMRLSRLSPQEEALFLFELS